MVMDELKVSSDDAFFNEDHIIFLLSKYRTHILKKTYSDIKKQIPESNYQTICIDLEKTPAIDGEPCTGGYYLKSTKEIPITLGIGNTILYPQDYYQGNITFVNRERMRYVGHNKFLQNIIYASLGPNNYLYLTSSNPQFLYLEKVQMTGIFEDTEKASELSCNSTEDKCDILDKEFPLEEALIPTIIEMVVAALKQAFYSPSDESNNAQDDLASLAYFIRKNMKSDLQKKLSND